jgi:hypothetical protein
MNDLLRRVVEAQKLAEAAEECMKRAEHPSIADCGECYVMAKGAADLLAGIERDLRSESMQSRTKGFAYALDADGACNPSGVGADWHVFRHGWGACVCGAKDWPGP